MSAIVVVAGGGGGAGGGAAVVVWPIRRKAGRLSSSINSVQSITRLSESAANALMLKAADQREKERERGGNSSAIGRPRLPRRPDGLKKTNELAGAGSSGG